MQRPPRRPWYQTRFALSLAGGLLLWAAFPPLGWWPLAWIAPWFWFAWIDRSIERTKAGRPVAAGGLIALGKRIVRFVIERFDFSSWFASVLHWMLLLQGLRLAHWGTYFGWIALSIYLAIYLPVFLALTSKLMQRTRLPLGLAAAISWTVLEWVRGHMLSGFSFGLLAHTQAHQLRLIQVADFSGAYGVSFLVILISGLIYRFDPWNQQKSLLRRMAPAMTGMLVLVAVASYGVLRIQKNSSETSSPKLQVGLVQGSIDAQFGEDAAADHEIFQLYNNLTLQFRLDHPDVNLVVWPESTFSFFGPELLFEPNSLQEENIPWDPETLKTYIEEIREKENRIITTLQARKEILRQIKNHQRIFRQHTAQFATNVNRLPSDPEKKDLNIHFILGSNTQRLPPNKALFNSALLVQPDGTIRNRYFKMHRVAFGEYIPGGNWYPWIYRLTPMGTGIAAGEKPVAFQLQTSREVEGRKVVTNWTLIPNICFESTVPHLVRRQVRELRSAADPPDALITISNDGWFWQSSMLDLHLLSAIFRAVENRLPLLTASNTGLSAWIDRNGQLQEIGPRRRPGQREDAVLLAHIFPSEEELTGYQRWGDWPWAILCLGSVLVACSPGKWWTGRLKKGGKNV